MVKTFQLSLAGVTKRVSDVYGATAVGADPVPPALDIPYRALYFQSETNALQLGQDSSVAANNYGVSIATGTIFPLEPAQPGAPLHLSDLWAFGTGTLHVLGIPL